MLVLSLPKWGAHNSPLYSLFFPNKTSHCRVRRPPVLGICIFFTDDLNSQKAESVAHSYCAYSFPKVFHCKQNEIQGPYCGLQSSTWESLCLFFSCSIYPCWFFLCPFARLFAPGSELLDCFLSDLSMAVPCHHLEHLGLNSSITFSEKSSLTTLESSALPSTH